MNKNSIQNVIATFRENNPEMTVTAVYHLYENLYKLSYRSPYDLDHHSTTLREVVSDEDNKD